MRTHVRARGRAALRMQAHYQQVQILGHTGVYLFNLTTPRSASPGETVTVGVQIADTNAPGITSLAGVLASIVAYVTTPSGLIVAKSKADTVRIKPGKRMSVSLTTDQPIPAQYNGQTLTAWVTTASNVEKGIFTVLPPGVGYDLSEFIVSTSDTLTSPLPVGSAGGGTSYGGTSFGGTSYGGGTSGGFSGGTSYSGGGGGGTSSAAAVPALTIVNNPVVQANNQPVTVQVRITNKGGQTGTWVIFGTLDVSDSWLPSSPITLAPGSSAVVSMTSNGGINPVNAGRRLPFTFFTGGNQATVSGTLRVAGASGGSDRGTGSGTGAPPVTTPTPVPSNRDLLLGGAAGVAAAGGVALLAETLHRRRTG